MSPKTLEGRGETRSVKDKEILNAESLRLVEMSGEVFYWAVRVNDPKGRSGSKAEVAAGARSVMKTAMRSIVTGG